MESLKSPKRRACDAKVGVLLLYTTSRRIVCFVCVCVCVRKIRSEDLKFEPDRCFSLGFFLYT